MGSQSKPEGYSSVSPYLMVEGAQRVVEFLKRPFDATDLRRYERLDGSIMHAEVRIDDTVVMIADSTAQWPPYSASIHVYVPELDATFRRALDAGGVKIQEPSQQPGDSDRRGGVRDPGGNSWWIATPVG
jgi:PhnB protein